jgi:serine/threonine protein kinase
LRPLITVGSIIATIQYMSPEQIEGKEADARSDIFAWAQRFTRRSEENRPFAGKSQISLALASAILESDPESLRTIKPATRAFSLR